jgi:hypothetical protein
MNRFQEVLERGIHVQASRGECIQEMVDDELYKQAGFATFEAFLKEVPEWAALVSEYRWHKEERRPIVRKLYVEEKLPQQQIAKTLGISTGTVSNDLAAMNIAKSSSKGRPRSLQFPFLEIANSEPAVEVIGINNQETRPKLSSIRADASNAAPLHVDRSNPRFRLNEALDKIHYLAIEAIQQAELVPIDERQEVWYKERLAVAIERLTKVQSLLSESWSDLLKGSD